MELSTKHYDFAGWITCCNKLCSDGRTIMPDAFKHQDGTIVPLVWNHQHDDPSNVLGKVLIHSRDGSMYGYCLFNDTPSGRNAKELVEHGDIVSLSILANKLSHNSKRGVTHGDIKEVSLVLAGANPGAFIDSVIKHGEESDEEAIIYSGEDIALYHAEEQKPEEKEKTDMAEEKKSGEKTVKEIFDEFTEEQKTVVYAMIGQALEDSGAGDDEDENINHSEGGNETMKHNLFDQDDIKNESVLSHSDIEAILRDGKRLGSLREGFFAHADDTIHAEVTQTYGINGTDFLFPEAHTLNTPPMFIKRDTGWVSKVMQGVHHTPFSRIKSMFANITEEDARAKGYIKGKLKKEEVFGLLKRTTTPTTVYKKQKLDRDDVIDITDFDVVAWIKAEMRIMLDEELARAFLIGDGRNPSSDDKINEQNIRPIWTDEDLYTIKALVETKEGATDSEKAKAFIRTVIKSRKNYKGSGEPTLYTTEDMLTECLLIEDSTGRVIYDTIEKLKNALRVKDIVTVPVMENVTRTASDGKRALKGIVVNLTDYNVGADKGGAVNLFDDFDIDYNQQKYLIETRCSGALVKPYAAIAVEELVAAEG